jgi:hypothetical protein
MLTKDQQKALDAAEASRVLAKAQMERLGKRLRDLAAHQREQAERLGGEKPRPQLVLIRGGKDDDA